MKTYDVIKNETDALGGGLGAKNVLVWKFTGEDFNDNSQLVVSEAEEAVFVKDGVAVSVFSGGRYTLNTNNHPFIGALRKRLAGGVSAFSCKVFFVNKDHKLELYWGTETPIQMRDPVLKLQTSIQARGSYAIQVSDTKKFLLKLIGNNIQLFTQEELSEYFRSAFLQNIKDAIAEYIRDSESEILEVCTEKGKIADSLVGRLADLLDEYGVKLVNFYVAAIDIPESDPNRLKLDEAFANKSVMGILGDEWGRQKSADILGDLANNPGAGGVAAAGAAAGVGFAAGSVFGDMASQMFKSNPTRPADAGRNRESRYTQVPAPAEGEALAVCPMCGAEVYMSARFCAQCGQDLVSEQECEACSSAIPPAGQFCPNCGQGKQDPAGGG